MQVTPSAGENYTLSEHSHCFYGDWRLFAKSTNFLSIQLTSGHPVL